jgi:hypothetical protein
MQHACQERSRVRRWAFFYVFGHLRDFFRAQIQKLRSSKVRFKYDIMYFTIAL